MYEGMEEWIGKYVIVNCDIVLNGVSPAMVGRLASIHNNSITLELNQSLFVINWSHIVMISVPYNQGDILIEAMAMSNIVPKERT